MKTVELTEKECAQVKAFILLGITSDEVEYTKRAHEGDPSYELKDKLDYYRGLAHKFD